MVTALPRICPACQTSNPPQAAFCCGCGKPLGQVVPELLHQRYHLLHKLGTGGFGAVYQAEDIQLGRRMVAVKEMSPQSNLSAQENAESTEAFRREAMLLAELMHPNLPRIYDHFSENGRWYLVMDYIEGETLEAYLNKTPDGYLPLPEALDMGMQLCDVLDYLIDFGIARHFKPGQAKDTVAFGSPGYAAPEQYGKTQTTPRSDIYSLGATLYQVLTGSDPSLNPFRFAPLHLPAGKPTPASLATLLARMLDMDEASRPASMDVVKTELWSIAAQVASGSFSSVVPATPVSTVSSTSLPASQQSSIGKLRCMHRGMQQGVSSLSWSPDSRCLASSSIDRSVQVWDMQTSYTYVNYSRHEDVVYRAAWSPNGKYIASDGYAPVVHVWEAMSGRQFLTYRGHSALILALGWSPDSQRLASGSYDTTVRVWEALSGRPIATYSGHTGEVHALSWSPDGAQLVSCSGESVVPIWNANTGQEIFVYRGHDLQPELQPVQSALYTSSGHPLPADKQFYQFVTRAVGVKAVAWSPDGQWIASAGADNIIHVWQAV